MPSLRIRPATTADAEAIAHLLTQLGYPMDATEAPRRLGRLAESKAVALIAEREGRVLGLATIHVLSVLNRANPVAWLTALVVDQEARASGVGRALVEAAEARGREAGCEWLSVTTHEDRVGARAFYPRVGLQATGRRFGKALRP
ncbi:MAG TPA: GNAT family N-acetyltransferase [Gemmatimonadales bacterium]|nr:GNAT family N-acetyltransferase [Gemmatimonadales bacterium]